MKHVLFGSLAAAALLFAPISTPAQNPQPPMSTARLEFNISSLNGLPVHGEARGAENLNYGAAVSVTVTDSRSVLHRLFLDKNHHIYFGYDLEAYKVEGQDQVHLHFTPLSSLTSFAGIDVSNFTFRSLPLPPDQSVPLNAPEEVPLEINAAGGQVLRDKLTFGSPVNTR
ncbi:MAG: hypothetical protein V4555_21075 [Acidobacteriota bacterium]